MGVQGGGAVHSERWSNQRRLLVWHLRSAGPDGAPEFEIFLFFDLFKKCIYGCAGSSLLLVDFLSLQRAWATL